MRCLERELLALGGAIDCETTALEIVISGGAVAGVDVRGPLGSLRVNAQRVVLAAGAWSERTIRHPLPRLGLRPVKGQSLRLRGSRLIDHVVRTPHVYLVPRGDGELLVGATSEEQGFSITPTAGAVMELLRLAWQLLPGIYDLELREVAVGLRPALDDHMPRIGPTSTEGLYLACGHYRHGILLAPATAHYLADCLTGRTPEALRPFLPQRADAEASTRDGGPATKQGSYA